jgi:diadenosine tetraphosphatase ApaH/serine/threonine PP2A family protein phosphatase
MTEAIYAIGDIHGRLDDLKRVHGVITRDQAAYGTGSATVVHVGDMVDRGPDSAGVIDYLIRERNKGAPWVVLKGNHDRFLQKFAEDADWRDPRMRPIYTWLHEIIGGKETLASYGVDAQSGLSWEELSAELAGKLPPEHLTFLQNLPLSYRHDDLVFVHAGLRPGVPLAEQAEDDLLWIRKEFHDHKEPFEHLVIHGHTVIDAVSHYGNRINIDTGAGYGHPLSAIVLEGREAFVLESGGRRLLRPA